MKLLFSLVVVFLGNTLVFAADERAAFMLKMCNYSKLSKTEKNDLLAYGLSHYAPEKIEDNLKLGFSNFLHSVQMYQERYVEKCGELKINKDNKECSNLIKVTTTAYRYDVGANMNSLKTYLTSQWPSLVKFSYLCPELEKNINSAMRDIEQDFNYEEKIAAADFRGILNDIKNKASIFNITLHSQKIPIVVLKYDEGLGINIYERDFKTLSCAKPIDINFSFMDEYNYKKLEMISKISKSFNPLPPDFKFFQP